MYAETLGCMYADFGCMYCMRKRLGAKYADVGRKSMERLGAFLTVFALPDNGPLLASAFVGSRRWSLAPPVHAQECCACTGVLCMHKNLVHAQESCACTRISWVDTILV